MNSIHEERMQKFRAAGIYLVTSAVMSAGRTTPDIIRAALSGGIRLIQLREKDVSPVELTKLAREARKLTADAGALLIINDSVDIAMTVGADGVHLGQDDFAVKEARRLAPDLIIGASTHSVEEAIKAQNDGASYINIGPLFPTNTKKWDAEFLGVDGLKRIAAVTKIPFTVMGGIKKKHIPELRSAGARTIAVVTEITAAANPEQAARDLLALLN
jgi:thiamine-phosphate pyrophosphorylase